MRVNAQVEESQQKQRETDELIQLVMGVLLIAFAVVAAAVLMTMQVSTVLGR
jgi:hypothetical protein